MPDTVAEIGLGAFQESGIRKVKLSAGLRHLGAHAFRKCERLEEIRLPDGLEEISNSAFENCGKLKKVQLPATLRRIGARAFAGCKSLEEIELPNGLEIIGNSAFEGCKKLRSFRVPATVRRLGTRLLFRCNPDMSVELPDRLRKPDVPPAQQMGLPDNRGMVIDGDVLMWASGSQICVPEGIREIAVDALQLPWYPPKDTQDLVLPSTLEVIRSNYALDDGRRSDSLPPLYFTHPAVLPVRPNVKLLESRLSAPGPHLKEAAAVYLVQGRSFLPLVLPLLQKIPPADMAAEIMERLGDPRFRAAKNALPRAALFWFRYSDELPADFGRTLAKTFFPNLRGKDSWQDVLLDAALTVADIDPESEAFGQVRKARGRAMAKPRLVKQALAPYVARACWLDSDLDAAKEAPDADRAAAQLDASSLREALRELLPDPGELTPLQLPVFLRFAPDAAVCSLAEDHAARCDPFGYAPCRHFQSCCALKYGMLLSDSSYATEFAAWHATGCDRTARSDTGRMLTEYILRQARQGTETRLLYPEHMQMDERERRLFRSGSAELIFERDDVDGFRYRVPKTGRIVKNIPKGLIGQQGEIRALRQRVEAYYSTFNNWLSHFLWDLFQTGSGIPARLWQRFAADPLLHTWIKGSVWQQGGLFFTAHNGEAVDADGRPVVFDRDGEAALVTPSALPEPLLQKWRLPRQATPRSVLLVQLSGPRYNPATLETDRFAGLEPDEKVCGAISDAARERYYLYDLPPSLPLGTLGSLEVIRNPDRPRYGGMYTLGRIILAEHPYVDNPTHHLLQTLDELTFEERLARDDATLISFLQSIDPGEFRFRYQDAILSSAAPTLRAAALEIANGRLHTPAADLFL